MSLSRYFLDIEDRVPASQLAVLERGAVVNGAQTSVNTVTVHAPHEIVTGDKFLYCPTRTNVLAPPGMARVFTVTGYAATTVTFSGSTFSFPDKALLLNVGADTGGSQNDDGSWQKLNFDAAVVSIYKDPAGDDAWPNSRADVDPGGEVGFWADGRVVWACTLDSGNRPLRVYPDMGASGSPLAIRSAVEPTPAQGTVMIWVESGGAAGGVGDRIKIGKVYWDDTTWDWFDVGDAE
jgi:hypothetical protein